MIRNWLLLLVSPKKARNEGYIYKTGLLDFFFVIISILSRFIYIHIQYERNYIPSLFVAAISATFTPYFSALFIEKIAKKYVGVTFSEISFFIWSIQAVFGILLVLICIICNGEILLVLRFVLWLFEAAMLVRYLWRYHLLNIGISLVSGLVYIVIASFFMV